MIFNFANAVEEDQVQQHDRASELSMKFISQFFC